MKPGRKTVRRLVAIAAPAAALAIAGLVACCGDRGLLRGARERQDRQDLDRRRRVPSRRRLYAGRRRRDRRASGVLPRPRRRHAGRRLACRVRGLAARGRLERQDRDGRQRRLQLRDLLSRDGRPPEARLRGGRDRHRPQGRRSGLRRRPPARRSSTGRAGRSTSRSTRRNLSFRIFMVRRRATPISGAARPEASRR